MNEAPPASLRCLMCNAEMPYEVSRDARTCCEAGAKFDVEMLGLSAPTVAVPPPATPVALDVDLLTDLIAERLSGTYHCTRAWSAWGVRTMSSADFHDVGESETPREIAEEIVSRFVSAPALDSVPFELSLSALISKIDPDLAGLHVLEGATQAGARVAQLIAARDVGVRLLEVAKRLVEHADFKLGGTLSANSKSREIPSTAVSVVKARHLAALRDAVAAEVARRDVPVEVGGHMVFSRRMELARRHGFELTLQMNELIRDVTLWARAQTSVESQRAAPASMVDPDAPSSASGGDVPGGGRDD